MAWKKHLDEDAFREAVLERRPHDVSIDSCLYAAKMCIRKGRTTEDDIYSCRKLALTYEEYFRWRLALPGIPPTPAESMTTDLVVHDLEPKVAQIRQELFGAPEPPFPTYEAAVEWLVRLGDEQWKRWQDQNEQKQREAQQRSGKRGLTLFWEPNEVALSQAKEKAGAVFHVSYERRSIPYRTSREDLIPARMQQSYHFHRQTHPDVVPSVEGCIWSVQIREDSILAKLEQAASEIADAIRFDKGDVVAWILADLKPFLSSWRLRSESRTLSLPSGDALEHKWAVIEFLQPEQLTREQMQQAYRSIREWFQVTRVKALGSKDQRLIAIVRRLGGVPSQWGMKTQFWQRVRDEWNREIEGEAYRDWRPLEKRYKRLTEKLGLTDSRTRRKRSTKKKLQIE